MSGEVPGNGMELFSCFEGFEMVVLKEAATREHDDIYTSIMISLSVSLLPKMLNILHLESLHKI